jgi:hypothetical protein
MASLSPRQRIQSFVQRITTPTVNSHPLIPLSEGEKATVRKHRLKNKKVALVRPTVHRPPPPPPPPHTLTHFIPNAAYLNLIQTHPLTDSIYLNSYQDHLEPFRLQVLSVEQEISVLFLQL